MQRLYLSGIQLIVQRLRPIGRLFAQSLLLLVIFCGLAPIVYTAIDKPSRPQAGLRNSNGSRRMSASQLQKAVESLRHKTGFLEMRFDESSFLTLGDRTRFAGGSAVARELLIATVDGCVVIEMETHNNSPHIAFAHITAGTVYTYFPTNARIKAWQVQLDFSDFAELRGERDALAAFDLGFAILHELVHGVRGLRDAVGETAELGACDELINRMRRELNLPERLGYNARTHTVLSSTAGATTWAELVFARERMESGRARVKRFYLYWNAKRVAGATNPVTMRR
jgi:hypothetical protein